MSTGGYFSGVEWQGYEADHATPSNTEVKNGGSIPLHSLMRFHSVVIKNNESQ
jgi:hypothetical protein